MGSVAGVPRDHQTGRHLQTATIFWNSGEVFITIALGLTSGSLALVAFGLDSLIEVFTSVVVLWHMGTSPTAARGDPTSNSRDDAAHRLVGIAFATLSVYLLVVSTRALIVGVEPDKSLPGIVYLAATAVVMLALARTKRGIGRRLDNKVFLAEARMTQLDAYLSIGILTSLSTNALWGWWWADPIAAASIGVIAFSEARASLKPDNAAWLSDT